jgi:hypothetical protein
MTTESFISLLLTLTPYVLAVVPGIWIVSLVLAAIKLPAEQRERIREYLLLSNWIGVFERWVAIYFIQQGELSALGFIVAAKGLLRWPQLRSDEPKDSPYFFSSYILLGTLASITLAIVLAECGLFAESSLFCHYCP